MPSLSIDLFEGLSTLEFQDDLVKTLLHSPPLEQFPPSSESQRRFWKWLVTFLEESGEQEVDERIYEACMDSLVTRSAKSLF